MKKTTLLKEYILADEILILPGVHDVLSAIIAQRAGFKAVTTGSFSNSVTYLGKPDVELLTLSETADCSRRVADAVDIPVWADGDNGHGNVTNVIRAIQLFEQGGVAGTFIEDQVSPKRCGHTAGKQVIPADEMAVKIEAAADARKDSDFIIMARTDAIAVNGIDDAIKRGNLCREAGADIIFVEAPESVEHMKKINKEINAPTLVNIVPGGKTPVLMPKELQKIGYAVVAYPTVGTCAVTKSLIDFYGALYRSGTPIGLEDRMLNLEDMFDFMDLREIRATEQRYYGKLGV